MKFYGLAFDDYGRNFVIHNLPEGRINAVNEAIKYCKENKLYFQGVYPVKGTERQGDILTKMTSEKRKRKVYF